jgi:hypothetical protein
VVAEAVLADINSEVLGDLAPVQDHADPQGDLVLAAQRSTSPRAGRALTARCRSRPRSLAAGVPGQDRADWRASEGEFSHQYRPSFRGFRDLHATKPHRGMTPPEGADEVESSVATTGTKVPTRPMPGGGCLRLEITGK